MASPKPRFGGAQNSMADSKHTHSTKMGDIQEDRVAYPNISSQDGGTCSEARNDHLQHLMKVFEELNIKCLPRPYIRCPERNVQVEMDTPERQNLCSKDINVVYCKNLFLKDRRGQFYIVVCPEETAVDLKMLKQSLNAHRNLSFGDADALGKILQLNSGEVTPLAIMHKSAKDVRVAIQRKLIEVGSDVKFAFHPLQGHLQVELSYSELAAFIKYFGREVEIIESETLNEKKESSFKHQRDLTDTKVKPNLDSKTYATIQTDNQEAVLQINKCLKSALPEKSKDSAKNHVFSEKCNKIFKEKMKIPAKELEIEKVAKCTVEFDSKLPVCKKLDENPNLHSFSHSFVNVRGHGYKAVTTVLKEQEQACHQAESSTRRNSDQPERLTSEVDSKRNKEPVQGKTRKRIFLSRKGKLRSYVKKHTDINSDSDSFVSGTYTQDCLECDNNDESNSGEATTDSDRIFTPEDAISFGYKNSDLKMLSRKKLTSKTSAENLQSKCVKDDMNISSNDTITKISQEKEECGGSLIDPEIDQSEKTQPRFWVIDQFYSSLKDSGVKHKESDLSCEGDGGMLEPSVGCRCFLLKDKGENFFFVVSHELYELDFGRLKAALRPKKKLVVAHPADVISVLGVDPMKVTPFAVLTMRDPTLRVFITRKVMAPNLMLCIQHPFAQARRIVMQSDQLQEYFTFLEVSFGVVEERHWNARFNTPFSQFDTLRDGSDGINHEKINLCESRNESENSCLSNTKIYDSNKENEKQKSLFSNFLTNIDPSRFLTVPLTTLVGNTFLFFPFKRSNSKFGSFGIGSPVDPPTEVMTQNSIWIKNSNDVVIPSITKPNLQNISIPMRTDDLENHLLSCKIKFQLKKKEHHDDLSISKEHISKQNAIIEHCAIMYLTTSSGHNFLIIGARDDFPMSVKRFCRRSQIREHLDIRLDPQEDTGNQLLWDIAPRMVPFALAFPELRTKIWEKFDSQPSTSRAQTTVKSIKINHKNLDEQVSSRQPTELVDCPPVTVALTTTLYIDPDTVMEFEIGQERSRLWMSSSEFDKYCRQVGFDVMYY
ncbi:hypothetical protein EGW08_016502 [Elysia chlorotica]|uniref:PrdX deacylase domain-containing protein 1 n=1 Tax=Elysia chlorotica TaxID=188477 RepID=A0A3S0ZEF7_ELYCH|nr:hypothetical protein EGW08_016502 [Elysia chlorotica]